MMTPQTPPPFLRPDVSAHERDEIEELLGPVSDPEALRAVRDGRGRTFQRFEFLGDSVLDVVLNVHRWVEPGCPRCKSRPTTPDASDRHLAEAARAAGVGTWLEWQASHERVADLVETCVAACWLGGRWPQTERFVSTVVHPMGATTLEALVDGVAGEPGKSARRVGSAILELASGLGVYRELPDADEGVLSTARAKLHRAEAVAARARARGEVDGVSLGRGDDDTVLSAVEDLLADASGRSGADVALLLAQEFVPARSD